MPSLSSCQIVRIYLSINIHTDCSLPSLSPSQIVRKCLQWDVKLNAMNQKGQTALHVAMAHRHGAVAEYLLR